MADPDSPQTADTAADEPLVIRLSRVAYLSLIAVLIIVVMFAGAAFTYFWWMLILPVLVVLWIRRLKTVVDDEGLTAVRTLRTDRVSWDDLAGLQFPKWSATRAVKTDGDRVPLPAVGFQDVPAIAERSGGRLPDPFAAEQQAREAQD
ncbi:PH domain-containing protein [Gordonia sp. (in: high G+C Gram-positive bacteria)]|uniref:PH domain-containing protein n=1 Tax=Gordonia sp. (in: high G+C Gram-positive bacteria) TaxID=84139 RepID=UPI0039E4CC81